MAHPLTGEKELVPIQTSFNRVLSEDLAATHDVPWFKRSPYDGYAIFSGSTLEAGADHPVLLEVVATIGAGFTWDEGIKPNQAVKIMTGAAIPDGADAMIMVELTKEVVQNGKTFVQIKRKVRPGENIVGIGEDMKKRRSACPERHDR